MKIVFVSEFDVSDIRSWSGTPYYMKKLYEKVFDEVECIQTPFYHKIKASPENRLREIGRFVSNRVKNSDADMVVCQGNSAIPFLDCEEPIVYWHDSTWYALSKKDFKTFSRTSPHLKNWDQEALNNCSLAIFASDWAAEGVLENYKILPSKVCVLPFGSNFEDGRTVDSIKDFLKVRHGDCCNLAFIGVNWNRKGLPLAIELTEYLNKQLGLKSRLRIIGCNPIHPVIRNSPFVTFEGFLGKENSVTLDRFKRILRETHFLVHPALFECFGCALVEANSFGIPIIATNVGGIPTIVRNDINGKIFSRNNFVESAARFVRTNFSNYNEMYRQLSLSSFNEYKTRLSWRVNGAKFKDIVSKLVKS
jgi:glycosyltransferase involved in cell wall biosynthesis